MRLREFIKYPKLLIEILTSVIGVKVIAILKN